ncbi:MAG: manganese-dependent inorganic pyrophosphatase [Proteobacteria bacterium]|nr:manganese-dependent inorganic pyrophosphatase [Pseudomonadota bacterium]MBU1388609.1 manganese-dependent inorganic pyrophosphatase [Pseudomonadota bacterium]MBU1541765.1 manganese-dependent inorganic pyrophosphatase [Pseudomonadota bacterium]MBU2482335.1 manganese-dependent inorganic pyrophosphatase [Pseudomonadota bacterium]
MSTLVFGHKNPDTDSVVAAIALADLKKKLGEDIAPAAQGALNPETTFVLKKYGVAAPQVVTSYAGKDVYLVDHSDLAQSPDDLGQANILGIVDHHKLGDVTTGQPLECWIWPVGCTCTVVASMYNYMNVEIPKDIAGIMLCAILSDTVIFKSATCTDADKKICEQLAKICGEKNLDALGIEMFKVKSAVEGTPIRELVFRDYKDFKMGGKGVGCGQLELVDLSIVDGIKAALEKDIRDLKAEKGHHTVLLMLTDIMKEGTELLVASDDESVVEKAFGVAPKNGKAWLPGIMSRKKQIIPFLEKVFG